MRDIVEQIYDELNAQVIRMLENSRKQAERIAELERENSSLAYELNVALSGGSLAIPFSDAYKLREAINDLMDFAPCKLAQPNGMTRGGPYVRKADVLDLIALTASQAPVREVDTNGLPG